MLFFILGLILCLSLILQDEWEMGTNYKNLGENQKIKIKIAVQTLQFNF